MFCCVSFLCVWGPYGMLIIVKQASSLNKVFIIITRVLYIHLPCLRLQNRHIYKLDILKKMYG